VRDGRAEIKVKSRNRTPDEIAQLCFGVWLKELRFVLSDARIDYPGHVIPFFFHILQQRFIAFLIDDVLRVEIGDICTRHVGDHGHARASGFLFLGYLCFFLIFVGDASNGFLDRFELVGSLGFSLLGVFLPLVAVFRSRRGGRSGRRLRLAWPACFVQGLGIESGLTFRTLDRPLLQVVEPRRAARANALGSEIRFGRSSHEHSISEGPAVCHVRSPLSKKFRDAAHDGRAQYLVSGSGVYKV